MRLKTVKHYINKLFNGSQISKEQKELLKPKASEIRRAYGLPKIHKKFQHLPKLRQIIDTTNISLSQNRQILTIIMKSVSAKWIHCLRLFWSSWQDKVDVAFGVDTLFANVPLKKTTKTIWNRVFSKFQQQLVKDCLKNYFFIPLPKLTFLKKFYDWLMKHQWVPL